MHKNDQTHFKKYGNICCKIFYFCLTILYDYAVDSRNIIFLVNTKNI